MSAFFLFLNFDDDDVNVGSADVFDRVGRIWRRPDDGGAGFMLAAVAVDVSVGIAANYVGAAEDVLHSGPAVGVDGNECSGRNEDVENADVFVLKDEAVEVGRGNEGVEVHGPGRWGRHGVGGYNTKVKTPTQAKGGLEWGTLRT
jgi:hypothetical protein